MIRNVFLGILFASSLAFPLSAGAADVPRKIAQHDQWGSYVITQGGDKICYMASQPKKQDGDLKGKQRGDVYALITHRPSEGTKNVFSYVSGYTYKPDSKVAIKIDDKSFTLFTKDDSAWAETAEDDNAITAALRKGKSLTVSGVSSRGTRTTDTFSLAGTGAAYADIGRQCAVK